MIYNLLKSQPKNKKKFEFIDQKFINFMLPEIENYKTTIFNLKSKTRYQISIGYYYRNYQRLLKNDLQQIEMKGPFEIEPSFFYNYHNKQDFNHENHLKMYDQVVNQNNNAFYAVLETPEIKQKYLICFIKQLIVQCFSYDITFENFQKKLNKLTEIDPKIYKTIFFNESEHAYVVSNDPNDVSLNDINPIYGYDFCFSGMELTFSFREYVFSVIIKTNHYKDQNYYYEISSFSGSNYEITQHMLYKNMKVYKTDKDKNSFKIDKNIYNYLTKENEIKSFELKNTSNFKERLAKLSPINLLFNPQVNNDLSFDGNINYGFIAKSYDTSPYPLSTFQKNGILSLNSIIGNDNVNILSLCYAYEVIFTNDNKPRKEITQEQKNFIKNLRLNILKEQFFIFERSNKIFIMHYYND